MLLIAWKKIQRSFFWGDDSIKKTIDAVDWESMCRNKREGGLGIGRMGNKNVSFLTKWVWRFGKEESVVCQIWGAK